MANQFDELSMLRNLIRSIITDRFDIATAVALLCALISIWGGRGQVVKHATISSRLSFCFAVLNSLFLFHAKALSVFHLYRWRFHRGSELTKSHGLVEQIVIEL